MGSPASGEDRCERKTIEQWEQAIPCRKRSFIVVGDSFIISCNSKTPSGLCVLLELCYNCGFWGRIEHPKNTGLHRILGLTFHLTNDFHVNWMGNTPGPGRFVRILERLDSRLRILLVRPKSSFSLSPSVAQWTKGVEVTVLHMPKFKRKTTEYLGDRLP